MNNKKIVRKAKFGDNVGNWAKGIGRFALGNIPLFGDNIVNAIPGLRDFEPENKFAKGLMNFNEKVLNPIKDQVATMAINSAAPGVGTALATANKGVDTAQYQNQDNSSKPLGIINPRYAQTGGPAQSNVKPVKGGNLHRLSSTGVYADGNSHKEGGIKINKDVEVEGGEGIHQIGKDVVVSSDSLQDPETGLTFAETMTKLESLKGKYEALLKQELEKNKNKTTSNVIVYKKKLKEIDDQIKATYSKQETVASQMGLRDKNGNPNQLSQDIVETPQKQAMAPTQLSKMGGRLRYYTGSKVKDKAKAEYNSRGLEGGFDEFQQTLNKAARQQEEEINNQIIKEENTDEFENLLPEVTVTANHKLLQNIAKNYNPQSGFSNTTVPFDAKFNTKLNTDVSGNSIVNNENTDKKQNQVVVKNENVAPIQANIKKEEQKNVRPTIDDNTQEYADEYIDVIRQRMGLQNQSPNFNKLQQRMKNIPSVAQFGDKFGGNLHKLKRFQDGGRTKVGKTINGQDMYRDDNIGGMYVNNSEYGDYSNSSEVVNAAGQQLNYGISESHAKRDDLPVVGGNTNTSVTNSVREQKTVPQSIPSRPISPLTPKPIIDDNNNTTNANLKAFKLIPGIGDIDVKEYNHPGFRHDWGIPKNDVVTPIENTTSNTKLPLNSNILTGKPRSKFSTYGTGRQLQALPKYDFNYHHNDTEYNEDEMKENLRILRRYGFNTDNLTKEQLLSLSKAIKGKMQYGGSPYITNTQGINPYPQKKENGWDKAGRIISGITGSIMPLLGGSMGMPSSVGANTGNSEMFGNLFKGLGGMNTGIMKKGGKVNKYKTGGWIQSVTKSIKKRGTAGRCTGSNFGGPGCPPGSRQYNLAVTFRKMARNRKHQYGGKIYDQNGYLTSNKSNFTSKKIIRGKNGQTPITTNGMAFPISANGKLLYPNTGNYIFPGNNVIETPIKAQMGLGKSNPYDAFKLTPTGSAYNDIMNPSKSNNNLFSTLPLVSSGTQTAPSGGTEASGNTGNMLPYRIAEGVTAASPLITEGMFQLFSKNYKDMKKKYPTDERRGEGLAQFKSNIDNALPNAQKMINDNQLSTLSTALEAAKNSGENPMTIAASVLPATFKSANELYSSVIGNLQNQLGQYHQWTKAIEDAKANEDYQTYNQALQNRQQLETRLKDSISKSLENANTYLSTYGPEGTRNAQKMVMDMLKQMPSLQQNDWWKSLMNQYGLDESGNKIQTPKVSKYGGNINNIRIKK